MGGLYEFWFDVIQDGKYLWEIERLHDKYGPIIRVNARELHIRDSQFYSSIYSSGARRVMRDPDSAAAFAVPGSLAATIDHHQHRARRAYLNPYFSKRSIAAMEPLMYERLDRLCQHLEGSMEEGGKVVGLDSAFSALTADIITKRFYGEHFDYLGVPDHKIVVTDAFIGITRIFNFARFFPTLVSVFKKLPIPLIRLILPPVAELLGWQENVREKILTSIERNSTIDSKSIIISAFADGNIPAEERKIDRLLSEGSTILFGGTETTSRALSLGMFYLLSDMSQLIKLREELDTLPFSSNNNYSMSQLESLPYLTGVVQESLRLLYGPMARLARIATDEPLQYKAFTIPPGTPVSQSSYFVHTDPSIYPNPHSFDPERWVTAVQDRFPLSKFLVTFSKGSRQCIGIQLALAELYLTIARLVRTFDMELHETTMDNIKIHHVRLIGYPDKAKNRENVRGEVKVKVVRKLQPNTPQVEDNDSEDTRSLGEEDPTYREDGKRSRAKTVNNSKYNTAAAWVQAHMLDQPVCDACLDETEQVRRADGFSLQEMAAHIRDVGVPDALASSKPIVEGDQPWEEALSGRASPPRLNMAKSHQPDQEVVARFDVDAVLAEVSSLQAFRGFRFSYYPRPQRNLQKPIHVQSVYSNAQPSLSLGSCQGRQPLNSRRG
ncbi:Trichodiene oxygenase [Hirsutella minnesotensis 3608]|uniref:Trichodiene oxygenase n=1 Tax=Hirsutella minnesotensis 3608 TaxID=1043627 RepID=A0A0F7ZIG9_9HYPO|nr:Trichodiene oxygenase [Hirsutella minnesotensis 3608]